MARLVGPDEGSRFGYGIRLDNAITTAGGLVATVWADAGGTQLADILTLAGAAITGSRLTLGSDSLIPLFQFPNGATTVYVSVNGGPVVPVYARATDQVSAAQAAAIADAAGRYRPVFPVGAATGVAATDTAAIIAQANAASAAGGGVVALRPGTYQLNATLPVLSGVYYQGVPPIVVEINQGAGYLPDGEWNYVGGTILHGDGTFPAFSANTVPQGSVPANLGATQISNAGIRGFGLDNFTYGIQVGAQNIMGMVWGEIDELWIKNCSQWAIWMVNFQHITVGTVRSCLSQNGQYWSVLMPGATTAPGNSLFRDLFHKVPNSGMTSRGVVFEAGGVNAVLGEIDVLRVQVNGYNKSLISQTATFTSGSTTVAMTDGTKYLPGMCVNFTTAGNGFTANNIYVVQSVAGNNITLGNSRGSAAISASASGTLTMQTYGFPTLEITAANSGAMMSSGCFHDIDTEGVGSVGVYVENAFLVDMTVTAVPTTSLVHLVSRGASSCTWHNPFATAKTDFDATGSCQFFGARDATYGYPLPGMWYDETISAYCMSIAGNAKGAAGGDFTWRKNFAYPTRSGVGEHIFSRNTNITLDGNNCGHIVYSAGVPVTFTLPTIVTVGSAPANSLVGLWFNIVNAGSGTITVNTDGTQLMNKIAGRTTVSVAPGNSLRVVAVEDGPQWWLATPAALTP